MLSYLVLAPSLGLNAGGHCNPDRA
jgi:hypothetical protein